MNSILEKNEIIDEKNDDLKIMVSYSEIMQYYKKKFERIERQQEEKLLNIYKETKDINETNNKLKAENSKLKAENNKLKTENNKIKSKEPTIDKSLHYITKFDLAQEIDKIKKQLHPHLK